MWIIYKLKVKKMQSINKVNKIGNPLKERDNWYKRLKA